MHACVCGEKWRYKNHFSSFKIYTEKKKSCILKRSHPLWRSDFAPFPQNIIHFIFIPSINLSAQFFFAPIWRISRVFLLKMERPVYRALFKQTHIRGSPGRAAGLLIFGLRFWCRVRGESQIDDLQTCTLQPTATAEQCKLCQPALAPMPAGLRKESQQPLSCSLLLYETM